MPNISVRVVVAFSGSLHSDLALLTLSRQPEPRLEESNPFSGLASMLGYCTRLLVPVVSSFSRCSQQ